MSEKKNVKDPLVSWLNFEDKFSDEDFGEEVCLPFVSDADWSLLKTYHNDKPAKSNVVKFSNGATIRFNGRAEWRKVSK